MGIFPTIRGTILGVPMVRTIEFGGLYIGMPLFNGKLPYRAAWMSCPICRSCHLR